MRVWWKEVWLEMLRRPDGNAVRVRLPALRGRRARPATRIWRLRAATARGIAATFSSKKKPRWPAA